MRINFNEDFNFEDKALKIKRNFSNTDKFFKDNYKMLRDIALDCCKIDKENNRLKNTYGPLNYMDDEDIILLTAYFFGSINPKYEEMFWDAYDNKKINYKEDIKNSHFDYNSYMNSYSINVHKSNTIKDAFSLVHETTHMLTMVKDGFLISTYKGDVYQEFPSILMEFMFCDYLKNIGISEYNLDLSEYDLEIAKETRKNEFAYNIKDIITKSNLYEFIDDNGELNKDHIETLKGKICFETESDIKNSIEESANNPVFYKYFLATVLACSVYNRGVTKEDACYFIEGLNETSCKDYLDQKGMDLNDSKDIAKSSMKRFAVKR